MTSRGPRDLPRSPATSHNLRVQLMAHQRLLELAPPADGIAAVLSSRRAYKGMGKKGRGRERAKQGAAAALTRAMGQQSVEHDQLR